MAPKANAFTPHLAKLIQELSDLRHVSNLAHYSVKQMIQERQKSIEKAIASGKQRPRYGFSSLSTRFTIPNFLSDEPFMKPYWTNDRMSQDEVMTALIQETAYRMHGQVLCEVFEAMELFLINCGAHYFFQSRFDSTVLRKSPKIDKKVFNKSIANWKKKPKEGTLEYYRLYSKHSSKGGCDWLLQEMIQTLPLFSSADLADRLNDLIEHYRAVEFCRHKIVHNSGTYEPNDLNRFQLREKRGIRGQTRKSALRGGQAILPDDKQVDTIIEGFAGIACFVYYALADAFRMKNDLQATLHQGS